MMKLKTPIVFLLLTSAAFAADPATKAKIAVDLNAVREKEEALPLVISPKADALDDTDAAKKKVEGPQVSLLPLTYEGAICLPKFGTKWLKCYQWIAPVPGQENQLYASYLRRVGKLQLPAPVLGDHKLAPVATWLTQPKTVGNSYRDLVLASGSPEHWAELRGIATRDNRLWLNHGKYYHVDSATYANFNSVALDISDETMLLDLKTPPARPHVKNHSGYLAAIPDGWHPTFKFVRGNYWQNGSDGGPRLQAFSPNVAGMPYKVALSHDLDHKIAGWSSDDLYTAVFFFEKESVKYVGIVGRKGTAPGWYGGASNPDKTITDLCSQSKGYHAYIYKPQILVYSWKDLLSVMAGAPTWSPAPVETILLTNFAQPDCARVSGAVFSGDKLWVVEESAVQTKESGAYDRVNLLHCYKRT